MREGGREELQAQFLLEKSLVGLKGARICPPDRRFLKKGRTSPMHFEGLICSRSAPFSLPGSKEYAAGQQRSRTDGQRRYRQRIAGFG